MLGLRYISCRPSCCANISQAITNPTKEEPQAAVADQLPPTRHLFVKLLRHRQRLLAVVLSEQVRADYIQIGELQGEQTADG